MVLNNYFGALYTNSSTGNVYLKYWENSKAKLNGRSERADTIYKENFQTGDVLVYQNTQEANENATYKTEDGIYYLIYISEEDKIVVNEETLYGFLGLNAIDENSIEINQISTDFTSLQTLLGKDYYVVLRPSMVMDKIEPYVEILGETELVTDGLIRNYEAINNTGNGHENSTTTWKNLFGNSNGKITGAIFSEEYLLLDGIDDWVNLGQISVDEAITIETTIEVNSINTSNAMYVVSNYNLSGGMAIYITTSGKITMLAYDTESSSYIDLSSGVTVSVGQKYNITGTFDGQYLKIYVDGELKNEKEFTGTYGEPTNDTVMALGARPNGNSASSRFADMKVYSLRIYNRVLAVEEVQQNIDATTEEEQEWEKIRNVIVRITDGESGLLEGAKLQYAWSEKDTEPKYWTDITVSGYVDGATSATFIAEGSNLVGEYYLWIKPVDLQDLLGNESTSQLQSNKVYKFHSVESIEIAELPNKTTYKAYENFEGEGLAVRATYTDESQSLLEDIEYQIIDGTNLTCLIDKIEIQYKENSEIKAYVEITVEHDETEEKVEETCTEQGYTTHTCIICGKSYIDTYIEAPGHSFTNYESNGDATCLEAGTETAKCERCIETDTRTEEGSALGHNYESKETVPTCTEVGYTTHTCRRCQDSYTDNEKEALGHSFTNYESNEDATCLEDGTETAKCERCTETDTRTEEGSALGHNYENGKCTLCAQEEPKVIITSEKYNISEDYITKITDETTVKEFKQTISTNATEIKILNKDAQELKSEDVIGTGMKVILKTETDIKQFCIVVTGDTTGDGKIDFKDMVLINKHRLNKKILEKEYFMSGDVKNDGKVDFKDLVMINKFRLNKITALFKIF